MACRGSGRVISNLGGTPKELTCPWCDGTGVRVPGIDAQARWPREGPAEGGGDTGGEAAQESAFAATGEDAAGAAADESDPVPPAA
jgi:hypothetical protein